MHEDTLLNPFRLEVLICFSYFDTWVTSARSDGCSSFYYCEKTQDESHN